MLVNPVSRPPGRAKLETNLRRPDRLRAQIQAANAAEPVAARITSTLRLASSAAKLKADQVDPARTGAR